MVLNLGVNGMQHDNTKFTVVRLEEQNVFTRTDRCCSPGCPWLTSYVLLGKMTSIFWTQFPKLWRDGLVHGMKYNYIY